MADGKDSFIDRKESYIASPRKEKFSKNQTTVLLAEASAESISESQESPEKKRRISSTSWQITKTTEITDEVRTSQKVTTMEFEIGQSGSVSPSSEKSQSFLSSAEFGIGSQKKNKDKDEDHDPSDEYVFIDDKDLGYVDRTEVTEVSKEQESVAPEAKKSYFAYLLDQNNSSGSEAGSKTKARAASSDGAGGSSERNTASELEQKKKDDPTMYERITYTPGLAIRSYAVEEMKQKKTGSPTDEDAENNNMAAGGSGRDRRNTESNSQGMLSPSEGYRISQIIAVQETELWEEERLKREREEYSIIDTLTMDDMMRMLGEHDRKKFEATQEANKEVFPIIPGLLSEKNNESVERSERSSVDIPVSSVKSNQAEDHKYSETATMMQRESHSTEVKSSDTSSQHVSGQSKETKSSDPKSSETSQRTKEIIIGTSSVDQIPTESSDTDSTSTTTVIMESRQTKTSISSHHQSSETSTQEMKTQIKSFTDAEQSTSMGIRSEQSATSLEGGVGIISPERQSVLSQSQRKDDLNPVPVEVERKFNITTDTEVKIKNIGGTLLKEKTFVDIYYDNPDYTLTLSDCWLRRRDNKWEMKVASDAMSFQDLATQYKEITKEADIKKYLKEVLKLSFKSSNLNEIVQRDDLTDFATISTTRKTYQLSNCTVDLDLTDHGFQVGEIEVMASSAADIPSALATIDDVARKLGLTLLRLN